MLFITVFQNPLTFFCTFKIFFFFNKKIGQWNRQGLVVLPDAFLVVLFGFYIVVGASLPRRALNPLRAIRVLSVV